jgi:hypothetical protein
MTLSSTRVRIATSVRRLTQRVTPRSSRHAIGAVESQREEAVDQRTGSSMTTE